MNTGYQDIKSYKKPNIRENLCPNFRNYIELYHMVVKAQSEKPLPQNVRLKDSVTALDFAAIMF